MNRQNVKVIVLVILGIIAIVMVFLAAFRFFKPDRGEPHKQEEEQSIVMDDPTSTLYVSKDAGESWRGIPGTAFIPYHLLFIKEKKRLLIGTGKAGIWETGSEEFKTIERGETGTIIPEQAVIYDLATLRNQSTLYAAAQYNNQGYLVALENPIRELFFAPLEDSPVRTIAIDPFTEHNLYIGAGMGIFESKDRGITWKALYRFKQPVRDIVPHPFTQGWLFVSTQRGDIFRTMDEGQTWEDLTRGFSRMRGSKENQRLHIDPVSGIIYLTSGHGLIASYDDGSTWEDVPLIVPPDSLPVIGFAVHPQLHTILYLSAGNQFYKSADAGSTWKGIQFPEKGSITVIGINPINPDIIVIGFAGRSESKSSILDFFRR